MKTVWPLRVLLLLALAIIPQVARPQAPLAGPITNAANGHWYYLLAPTNWNAAEQIAVSLGGRLATINNAAENEWVFTSFSNFGGVERALWLGLNDAAQEQSWSWVNGETLGFLNWSPGQPTGTVTTLANEDYVMIWPPSSGASPGSWNDAAPETLNCGVVEVGGPEPAPPIILSGPITNAVNGHWYYLLNYFSWPAAEQIAISLGGHLATINDATENQWIFDTFSGYEGGKRAMWIGLNDSANEGTWTWISSEPPGYLNWAPGEPNSGAGVFPDEDQALIWNASSSWPAGTWNDAGSNQLLSAIVEVAPPVVAPVITVQPLSRSVTAGDSVFLSVTATGTTPFRYQWRLNGTNLPGMTNRLFYLASAQPWHAGYYSVMVSNAADAVESSKALLTVVVLPPVITAQPTNATTFVDGNANFRVGVTGSTPLTYRWFFERSPLACCDSSSLDLMNVQPAQAGNYFVVVSNIGGTVTSTPALLTVNAQPPCVAGIGNLVNWWRAESNTVDSAGSAELRYSGIQIQSNQFLSGEVGAGFRIGVRSYFVTTNLPALDLGAGASFTVEAWMRPDATVASQSVIEWKDSSKTDGVGLMISTNALQAFLTDTAAQPARTVILRSPTNLLQSGIWQHVGLTYDKISGVAAIYHNGNLVAQNNVGVIRPNTSPPLYFGGFHSSAIRRDYFEGGLDEVSLYDRALRLDEIRSIYLAKSAGKCPDPNQPGCTPPAEGLISWWPLDTNVQDALGSNDGTFPFSPPGGSYATGKVQQALIASSTGFTVPNSPSLNFGSNDNFSIEAWVKTSSLESEPIVLPPKGATQTVFTIASKQFVSFSAPTGFRFEISNGLLSCSFAVGTGISTNQETFTASAPDLRDGMFHHLALTFDRSATNGGRLLVDGATVLTFEPAAVRGSFSNLVAMEVGRLSFSDTRVPANHLLDELAIYRRALSPNEVQAIFIAGAAGKCPIPLSILVHPISQRVTIGSNATLRVTATGTPPLRYQWYRNTQAILTATNPLYAFTMTAGSTGTYSVQVSNASGSVLSSSAVLTLNHAPGAIFSSYLCYEDAPALFRLNVFDADKDPLTVTILSPPTHGLLSKHSGETSFEYLYSPFPDFNGSDSFTFTINDGLADSAAVTDAISVLAVEDPPVAFDQSLALDEDAVATITLVATDADGDPLVFNVGAPAHGSLTGTAPNLVYRPNTNYNGPDSFTFSVSDGQTNSNVATVSLTVRPVNDVPVAEIVVAPLSQLPGISNRLVIAPVGTNATVFLDGSRSTDVENDPLQFRWSEGTNAFAQGLLATNAFAPGRYTISLIVSDGPAADTNSVELEILSPVQAVAVLRHWVETSDLAGNHGKPLQASLRAAAASFERGNASAGLNQLQAFQSKVAAQIAPDDPVLARLLDEAAQEIIDALSGPPGPVFAAGAPISSTEHSGKFRMRFHAPRGHAYFIAASTDLRRWQIIGLARATGSGQFEFEDRQARQFPGRFYRITAP